MKKLLVIAVMFFMSRAVSATPARDTLAGFLKDSLRWVTLKVKRKIDSSRYMEKGKIGDRVDLKGWEGVKVTLYRYSVRDTRTSPVKPAEVYLCDAGDDRIARWVISACWQAKHRLSRKLVDRLVARIDSESGAQFPVMGIVYEDMDNIGFQKPWVFMDGVTVFTKLRPGRGVLSQAMIDSCINLSYDKLENYSGAFGRIASTTREQYKMNGGREPVGSTAKKHQPIGQQKMTWLPVVRDLYKKALRSDNNELITAWAKANL